MSKSATEASSDARPSPHQSAGVLSIEGLTEGPSLQACDRSFSNLLTSMLRFNIVGRDLLCSVARKKEVRHAANRVHDRNRGVPGPRVGDPHRLCALPGVEPLYAPHKRNANGR